MHLVDTGQLPRWQIQSLSNARPVDGHNLALVRTAKSAIEPGKDAGRCAAFARKEPVPQRSQTVGGQSASNRKLPAGTPPGTGTGLSIVLDYSSTLRYDENLGGTWVDLHDQIAFVKEDNVQIIDPAEIFSRPPSSPAMA